MKVIILVLLLSSAILAQTENFYQTGPGGRPISIVDKISYNLELLERDYLTKLSYRDYVRAKDLLIETYNLLLAIPLPPPPNSS
jgi:hypothetical protein